MIKNKRKVLSIVIKNEHIKLSEVSKNGRHVKVHFATLVPVPAGSVADGAIENVEALETVLRQAIAFHRLGSREVVFSIVSGRIATKEIVIPEVKDNRIADVVNANASEYFPVEIDEYIIRHTVLERYEEADIKKLRLQLVAAPKSMIEQYQALAKKLELTVADIDYSGNSIYQLLNQQIGPEYCSVIDIEGESTVVSIFQDNVLKMQRTVPYGKSLLTEAVSKKYGLTTEEEVRQKLYDDKILHISFDTDEVTESLAYLVNGVKRITDYYISRNGGKAFEKSYVVGDAVTIPGFVTLLSNEMGTELTPMETLEGVTLADQAVSLEKYITEYISAIGALIQPIGLFIEEQKEQEKKGNSMRTMVMVLALAVVASAVMVIMPLMDVLTYKDKIETAEKNIDRLIYVEDIVDKYYESVDKTADAMAFLALTSNNNDYLHIFVDELEKKMPSDIALGSVSVSSGSVSLSGTAASKSSLAKFIQQLYSIESVSNVYISNESESMDNVGKISVSFSLTCTFSRVTPGEDGGEDAEAGDNADDGEKDDGTEGDNADDASEENGNGDEAGGGNADSTGDN